MKYSKYVTVNKLECETSEEHKLAIIKTIIFLEQVVGR